MEQIILSFGLGIMLISNIVLVYVVLKSNKKVNEYEKDILKFKNDINSRYTSFDKMVRDLGSTINQIDRKVDSRTDKLDARVMMELERFKKTYIKDY